MLERVPRIIFSACHEEASGHRKLLEDNVVVLSVASFAKKAELVMVDLASLNVQCISLD